MAGEGDALTIKARGWRQGSILPPALLDSAKAVSADVPPVDVGIIVSHSCDVCQSDLGKEPFVEILLGRTRDVLDGTLTFGKNPRVIQLELAHEGLTKVCEFSVHHRVRLPRGILAAATPDPTWAIEPAQLRALVAWLARRYDRSAFPDEFNRRLGSVKKLGDKVKRLLRKHGSSVLYLLARLSSLDDLPPEQTYRVRLVLVMAPGAMTDSGNRIRVESELLEPIVELLGSATGIEVVDYDVLGLNEMSAEELVTMSPLDEWDYLSYE